MKKLFIYISCCLLWSCNQNLPAGDEPEEPQDECAFAQSWDYPVKPGTEEWKEYKNSGEMIDACQIPEDVLFCLTTDNLTELCLQYPLLYDVLAFNNLNDGLSRLFDNFNGMRELSKRENAVNNLLSHYLLEIQSFPDKVSNSTDLDIGYSIMHISTLEILLSYSELHGNSSKETLKKVLKSLLIGYQEKHNYSKYFRWSGFAHNVFARVHIILQIDPALSELFNEEYNYSVLAGGRWADIETLNTIDSLSYKLIK